MTTQAITPFGRYVQLYTLHQVERPLAPLDAAHVILLRVRIETLRYSFAPLLDLPLDDAYAEDPREGAALVRDAVLPRLHALLDAPELWPSAGLLPDRESLWQQYAAARGLPANPARVPTIHAPTARPALPAQGVVSRRLSHVHRALDMLQTAAETASTLATLWQNWQIGREQRQLMAAQRALLQSAVTAQIAAQDDALTRGLDRPFVRGYLAGQGDDPGHDAIFGASDAT